MSQAYTASTQNYHTGHQPRDRFVSRPADLWLWCAGRKQPQPWHSTLKKEERNKSLSSIGRQKELNEIEKNHKRQ